jgi:hypothetical protein
MKSHRDQVISVPFTVVPVMTEMCLCQFQLMPSELILFQLHDDCTYHPADAMQGMDSAASPH